MQYIITKRCGDNHCMFQKNIQILTETNCGLFKIYRLTTDNFGAIQNLQELHTCTDERSANPIASQLAEEQGLIMYRDVIVTGSVAFQNTREQLL